MTDYKITVHAIVEHTYEIEADDEEQAKNAAYEMYSEAIGSHRGFKVSSMACDVTNRRYRLDTVSELHTPTGSMYYVINPHDTHDASFTHLTAGLVEINGKPYKVEGVEKFAHNPPWRKGETIGLRVTEPSPLDVLLEPEKTQ